MNILILGDVVGQGGCNIVRDKIPAFKKQNQIDITIANGENSAEGNGILPASAAHLFDSGVDIITTGNHALRRREVYDLLNAGEGIIRPVNFHRDAPGYGYYILDKLRYRLCIINLQGVIYMDNLENPFDAIDRVLAEIDTPNIIVDFHAEATSEKVAMGHYLNGRVSLMYGTHTHIQTADEKILSEGTGYITDIGMCGGYCSVLGVKSELAIKRLRTNLPTRFENEQENCFISGIIVQIDEKYGKTTKIHRVIIN